MSLQHFHSLTHLPPSPQPSAGQPPTTMRALLFESPFLSAFGAGKYDVHTDGGGEVKNAHVPCIFSTVLVNNLWRKLCTRKGCYLEKRLCKQFSKSSPCLPGQQDSCCRTVELSENSVQNLFSKKQPSPVVCFLKVSLESSGNKAPAVQYSSTPHRISQKTFYKTVFAICHPKMYKK